MTSSHKASDTPVSIEEFDLPTIQAGSINKAISYYGGAPLKFSPVQVPDNIKGLPSGTVYRAQRTGDIRKDLPGAVPYWVTANNNRRSAWSRIGYNIPDSKYQEFLDKGILLPVAPLKSDQVIVPAESSERDPIQYYLQARTPTDIYMPTTIENYRNDPAFFIPAYNASGYGKVNGYATKYAPEELIRHWYDNTVHFPSVIPQAVGGKNGESRAISRALEFGQSYDPHGDFYDSSKWIYPPGHAIGANLLSDGPAWKSILQKFPQYDAVKYYSTPIWGNLNRSDSGYPVNQVPLNLQEQYIPAAYTYNPWEAVKSLGFLKHQLRTYGQAFNTFSDTIPWLHRNGFFTGGRFNAEKFGYPEAHRRSPLYSELFGQYRDLSDNLMLLHAAYKRDPFNESLRRRYQEAKDMYHNFMDFGDNVWSQLVDADPVGEYQGKSRWDPVKSPGTAKVNAETAERFRKARPWMNKDSF